MSISLTKYYARYSLDSWTAVLTPTCLFGAISLKLKNRTSFNFKV